jgi:SpoU rRNA methylase family enzyme
VKVLIVGILVVISSWGCSAAQVQKDQVVLMQLKTDTNTVVVSGCKDLPAVEVLAGTIIPLVPQLAASAPTIAVAESLADSVCKAVLASQPPVSTVAK